MKTAIIQAALMYGIAFVISMLVAVMIKVIFAVVSRFSGEKKS
jgi:hypothetical protein